MKKNKLLVVSMAALLSLSLAGCSSASIVLRPAVMELLQ